MDLTSHQVWTMDPRGTWAISFFTDVLAERIVGRKLQMNLA